MKSSVRWLCWIGLIATVGLTGCGPKSWVLVPPEVELRGFGRVGLVGFSGTDPTLNELATRQFQEAVLGAQPGVRMVEIPDGAEVANLDGPGAPDPVQIERIASKYGLDALFVGNFEITKASPRIDLSTSLLNLGGSIEQQAVLSTRLIEAGGGTVWSRSAGGTIEIGRARLSEYGGRISVGDPTSSQTNLVRDLAGIVTDDFRPTYYKTHPDNVPPGYVLIYVDGDPVWAPPPALTQAE